MPIEGPLRELGIHDVFQLLDLSRKTGVLRVTSELRHNAGTVYFEDGAIIFAEIRSNPHPLGALLLRTGKITEADLERGRDMQRRQGDQRRLGEILVSLGAITPRELQRQIRFQIEEVVFELMSWQEGYFSFTEGTLTDLPTDATVRIPTEALLMEGARRIDEWSRIESRIPHLGVIPTLAPPAAGAERELDLLPPECELLAVIDRGRALRLDPLLVAAHRCLGYALVATGRFAEAVEQWEQWERLAARSETELAQLDEVRRAKTAAQTLGGTGAGLHA